MRSSDWSSDVCSSDLLFNDVRYGPDGAEKPEFVLNREPYRKAEVLITTENFGCGSSRERSEERRVGKEVSVRVDLGGRRIIQQKTSIKSSVMTNHTHNLKLNSSPTNSIHQSTP